MNERPIVIVDPYTSGAELAPAFARRGHPAIAVLSSAKISEAYPASGVRRDDFVRVDEYHPDLARELRARNPIGVVAGSEAGVEVADILANALTPDRANDLTRSAARRHKGLMHEAVAKAGLPIIRGIHTDSAREVADWLSEHRLGSTPLVVKPVKAGGTDNVHFVPAGGDWRPAFELVLRSIATLTREKNEAVVVQEYAEGIEYSVDTVSCNGAHTLSNILRYTKITANGRMAIWDHTEFIPFDRDELGSLVAYTYGVLDAVGIRWGAAHTEVIVTADGPRLVEVGARMCGGPQPTFARVATGSSQVERQVEIYLDGRETLGDYQHLKCVMPIFLIAPASGAVRNIEVFDEVSSLATHFGTFVRHRNGDHVPRTVDFFTILGIVTLAGRDRNAVLSDYARVREIESRLSILTSH